MVVFEKFRPLFWWIVAIAALNWGLVAFADVNLITDVISLSSENADYVYGAIGVVALINMYNMAHEM
jgi:uncharacterized membrane protein YuzA (DUF378 family)